MTLRGFATIRFSADDVPSAVEWYRTFLGIDPYFEQPGPDGRPAYVEFRVGDLQAELGIVDRRYEVSRATEPGGATLYWHVDDLDATVAQLLAMGATEHEPITVRGDAGFVTASVIDPFGNLLGVMYNPHYLEILKTGSRSELPPS